MSVVDLKTLHVAATIQVGDEPQGLCVAEGKLYVACARSPIIPTQPGQVDPGDFVNNVVVVTDASFPFAGRKNIALEALRPRDVVAIGNRVYAIPQNSGNETTILDETETKNLGLDQLVPDSFDGGPFPFNPVLDRPVAVKLITGEVGTEDRERFQREARAVAKLQHPNVVVIYDLGLDRGRPFIAMELLDGQDLKALMDSNRPLPVTQCLEMMRDVCLGLDHCHAKDIVHRPVELGLVRR